MPDKKLEETDKLEGEAPVKVVFKCQCCNKIKPLKEMRSVTRFIPVLVVCSECDKILR
jgi:hypothetical protein